MKRRPFARHSAKPVSTEQAFSFLKRSKGGKHAAQNKGVWQAMKKRYETARLLAVGARTRFYKWLFGTPTMVIETLNACLLLTWAGALFSDDMVQLPQYAGWLGHRLTKWNEAVAVLFLIAAAFAFLGAVRKGYFANRLAGYSLQFSAVLWLGVAMNFYASYPPINTGMIAYSMLSLFFWTTGNYLWTHADVIARRCGECTGNG